MNEVATSPELDLLVDNYKGGRLNRRQFVKGAVALGVTVSAAGSILAACGSDESPATFTVAPGVSGGEVMKGGTLREGYDLDFS